MDSRWSRFILMLRICLLVHPHRDNYCLRSSSLFSRSCARCELKCAFPQHRSPPQPFSSKWNRIGYQVADGWLGIYSLLGWLGLTGLRAKKKTASCTGLRPAERSATDDRSSSVDPTFVRRSRSRANWDSEKSASETLGTTLCCLCPVQVGRARVSAGQFLCRSILEIHLLVWCSSNLLVHSVFSWLKFGDWSPNLGQFLKKNMHELLNLMKNVGMIKNSQCVKIDS